MTHTHTYTTMNVLVLDQRKGNSVTDDIQRKIDAAECVLYIEPDGHVNAVMRDDIKTVRVEAAFVQMPHRDEISAEKSRGDDKRREEAKDEDKPTDSPAEQFKRVWDDSPDQGGKYPGNHGTARITGKL